MTPKVSAEWLGRVDFDNLPDQFPSLVKATGRSCELEVINIYDEQQVEFRMMKNGCLYFGQHSHEALLTKGIFKVLFPKPP